MSQDLLNIARERAERYLTEIDARRVFPDEAAMTGLEEFEEIFPEQGTTGGQVLELLDRSGAPATVASAGRRYFGFVVGGTLPVTVGANWLATAWDQVASSKVTSPVMDKIEQVTSGWLLDVLDLPRESVVGYVTGATMATFTALAAARHKLLARQGWDVEARGLFGAPEIKVVVSDEVHVTVLKALSLLGFGKERVVRVPTDANGAMDISRLPELDAMTIICVQAGNVNSGAFDPAGAICDRAAPVGAWVHVDGAFGLWARASKELKHLTAGVEKADSWATDGHKWLNTPYDAGVVICRDQQSLYNAMSVSAAYLREIDSAAQNYMPEFSKRARGVEIWAALKFLGRKGVDELVTGCCHRAGVFARGLEELGLTIQNSVVLNQVVVSWDSPEKTEALMQAVQKEGTCWFGPTVWKGKAAFRISVSSWKTTEEDIQLSLQAIKQCMVAVIEETQ
ncbi:pyridoxal phosphate-dependent decarboxylase family protein [Kiloniella laminariae]|uniref:pyridoxal phosphate-dependent decarboxylase family protein n=1 Tax=Kiloniella laminariae TaxID=454162 RepID=UPI0003631774|nr:aminotransferase class V-fold PLP-dependent enzyme [Kiloniella laminariae]